MVRREANTPRTNGKAERFIQTSLQRRPPISRLVEGPDLLRLHSQAIHTSRDEEM